MSRKPTIGITAASGKLGSAIVSATVAIVGKQNVVGLARTPSKAESLGVEVRSGDYTTRGELAEAYARMLADSKHNGQTYNLHGEAITQQQLAGYLSDAFGTSLSYREMSVEEYRQERIAELGEFLGTVIEGIYEGIRNGAANNESHYREAAGREHQSWQAYFDALKFHT